MKRVVAGIILGCITFVIIVYLQFNSVQNEYQNYQIIIYQLQDKKYRLLVADRPDKWEKGLMYYKKLNGVDGMVFIFPDEKNRNFWNKNTYLDLTLYWIDKGEVTGKSSLPSIEKTQNIMTVSSPGKADTVVELPVK